MLTTLPQAPPDFWMIIVINSVKSKKEFPNKKKKEFPNKKK